MWSKNNDTLPPFSINFVSFVYYSVALFIGLDEATGLARSPLLVASSIVFRGILELFYLPGPIFQDPVTTQGVLKVWQHLFSSFSPILCAQRCGRHANHIPVFIVTSI